MTEIIEIMDGGPHVLPPTPICELLSTISRYSDRAVRSGSIEREKKGARYAVPKREQGLMSDRLLLLPREYHAPKEKKVQAQAKAKAKAENPAKNSRC